MGSVECVTFHEPDSQDNWGGATDAEGSVVGSEEGARRVTMIGGCCIWVAERVGWVAERKGRVDTGEDLWVSRLNNNDDRMLRGW